MSDEHDRFDPLPRELKGMPIGGRWDAEAKPVPIEVEVVVDGQSHPPYALRAGQRIAATEYDAGSRRLTLWIEGRGRVPESTEVEAEAR